MISQIIHEQIRDCAEFMSDLTNSRNRSYLEFLEYNRKLDIQRKSYKKLIDELEKEYINQEKTEKIDVNLEEKNYKRLYENI